MLMHMHSHTHPSVHYNMYYFRPSKHVVACMEDHRLLEGRVWRKSVCVHMASVLAAGAASLYIVFLIKSRFSLRSMESSHVITLHMLHERKHFIRIS